MVQTISNTENTLYTLSIQVSLNGLSFCIANSNEVLDLQQFDYEADLHLDQVLEKIKKQFDNNPALNQEFSSIEVIYQNDLYTFVPKALFDEKLLKDYLKYTIKVLDNDFIAFDTLDQHDMVNVYIPYANINNFFFEIFGSFTYKHSCTVLVDTLITQQKNKENTVIYAHIENTTFDLIIFKHGKLILCNTYRHQVKEDFLYYLMFAAEQLHLNPEEFELILIGDIDNNDEYYQLAYRYIRNIKMGKRSSKLPISIDLDPRLKDHKNFILLSNHN